MIPSSTFGRSQSDNEGEGQAPINNAGPAGRHWSGLYPAVSFIQLNTPREGPIKR